MNLAARPVSVCGQCGARFRDYGNGICPVCWGTGEMKDADEFLSTAKRTNQKVRAKMTGEVKRGPYAQRRMMSRQEQVAQVNELIAQRILKTHACRDVGIAVRVYDYWAQAPTT